MKAFKLFWALLLFISIAGLAMAEDIEVNVLSPTPTVPAAVLTDGAAIGDLGGGDANYFDWPSAKYMVLLVVNVTEVTDIANTSPYFTVIAGDNPPAFRAGLGSLDIPTEEIGNYIIGPLESARFKTADDKTYCGGVNITAGTVSIIEVKG